MYVELAPTLSEGNDEKNPGIIVLEFHTSKSAVRWQISVNKCLRMHKWSHYWAQTSNCSVVWSINFARSYISIVIYTCGQMRPKLTFLSMYNIIIINLFFLSKKIHARKSTWHTIKYCGGSWYLVDCNLWP